MSSFRRRLMMAANAGGGSVDTIIMTAESNAPVLSICYSKGWCASDQYMTASEAAAVTNIGTSFMRTDITHFEELEYFTGISSLAQNAFQGCGSLVSIKLPNTITTIGGTAFQGCSKLESMEFPSGVTSIGNLCFYQCSKLLAITSHATTEPTIAGATFLNISQHGTLYVPTGSNYSTWMSTGNNYLGKYNWTKVEF